jgi:hypothetical protein
LKLLLMTLNTIIRVLKLILMTFIVTLLLQILMTSTAVVADAGGDGGVPRPLPDHDP